jgi:hypothetical protein
VLPAHHRRCGNYKKGDHGGHHQQHYCCQYWRSRASLFCCAQTWRPSERIWATSRERERERERSQRSFLWMWGFGCWMSIIIS